MLFLKGGSIEPRWKIRGDPGYFVSLCYTKFQDDGLFLTNDEC